MCSGCGKKKVSKDMKAENCPNCDSIKIKELENHWCECENCGFKAPITFFLKTLRVKTFMKKEKRNEKS